MSKEDGQTGTLSKDKQLLPTQIEIGTSIYTFSEDAQRYIFPIKLADFDSLWLGLSPEQYCCPDYEKRKSVLVVSDPHYNATAQFRLYKGLEVFLQDNPALIKKTVFLAEGYPANKTISVQSLIKEEPHPSDKLIRDVLNSFLIPGYIAYEWKHQQGIPIVGIEDQPLYKLSREFGLVDIDDPSKIFFSGVIKEMDGILQTKNPSLRNALNEIKHDPSSKGKTVKISDNISITISNDLIWNITYREMQRFMVGRRNKRMAQTLIENSKRYENPMLFIGQGHLYNLNDNDSWIFDLKRIVANKSGPNGPLGREAWLLCNDAENKGVYHYLREQKIGFTFLDPVKLGDLQGDAVAYLKLHRFQQNDD